MVASIAPQLSWPSTRISGELSTATPYSRLATVSSLPKLPRPGRRKIAAAAVEGVFGRDTQIRATQDAGVGILAAGQRLPLMLEIVPARHALDIAFVPCIRRFSAASGETAFCGFGGFVSLAKADGASASPAAAPPANCRKRRRDVLPGAAASRASHNRHMAVLPVGKTIPAVMSLPAKRSNPSGGAKRGAGWRYLLPSGTIRCFVDWLD